MSCHRLVAVERTARLCFHVNIYSYVDMFVKIANASILAHEYSDDTVVQLADLFRLIGDPTRLRIVFVCLDEATSVGDIASRLALSPSLVSHHLRLLKAARILRGERRGKQIFYSALDEHISCVISDMVAHVGEPHDIEGAN
jgi:DNA-binding transcriptional ArsR family regulator